MKYGYNNIPNNELIERFTKDNNCINVQFLDGSNYSLALTKTNEKLVINKMLKQAKDRDMSNSMMDAHKRKLFCIDWATTQLSLSILNVINVAGSSSEFQHHVSTIIYGITAVSLIIAGDVINEANNEIEEILKYKLYLAMKNKLAKYNDEFNYFNNIDINNLDDYSLSDIKQFCSRLKQRKILTKKNYKKAN